MADFREEERLKALRERLYSRGKGPEPREKYTLTGEDAEKDVPTVWKEPPGEKNVGDDMHMPETDPYKVTAAPEQDGSFEPPEIAPMAHPKIKRGYRKYVLLVGLSFFVLSIAVSSLLFFLGGNTISGDNIAIDLTGPFTVGGGEALPLQVGVTNQNTVPIESATLIITYPDGTQSVTEEGKELFVERLPLETIDPGETLNIPLRAIVFGEENQEKTVRAEIEYRVSGSNSTFAKEAEPLSFKISSSPVIVSVDALQKVSSGQDNEITLTISSNSPNTLNGLIVRADYPAGFDYTTSDPQPVSGQNIWRIDSLEPEGETTITITGVIVGGEDDQFTMHFSAGVPNDQDRLSLSSVFSTAATNFVIEQPFIGVDLSVNGNDTGTVAVEAGERVSVQMTIENTTDDTIFDGRVELSLSGNALTDYEVIPGSGFYDSTNNRIYWDASSIKDLQEIEPGGTVMLNAVLRPDPDIESTPSLAFDVDARAKRVAENQVTEVLIGTAQSVVKVSSVATLITEVGRNTSTFADTGPLPPVAEMETTYTLTMFIQNGTNDVGDARVTAPLPSYVEWLGNTSGAGTFSFNETARILTWDAGSIDANQSKIASFQISFLPSISQIDTTPTLIGDQQFRATDRFTGAVVRARMGARTTRLSEEAGYPVNIGEVISVEESEN